MNVTFFGHDDAGYKIKSKLNDTIIDLIVNHNADKFYIGNNSRFDFLVESVLKQLKQSFPQIEYVIVLAFLPNKKSRYNSSKKIYPEILNDVPFHYKVFVRNQWMIEQSDTVISYVKYTIDDIAKYRGVSAQKRKDNNRYQIRQSDVR